MWLLQIDISGREGGPRRSRLTGALVSAASSAEQSRSVRQKNGGSRANGAEINI